VHIPIQAPAALVEKYKAKAHRLGLDKIDPMDVGEAFPVEEKKDKNVTRRRFQSNPIYAAMIENLDTNVGRLMAELENQGIANDTIVILTSDNGGLATAEGSPTSNAPLSEGKGWMYDGGVREPLIVRWPAVIRAGAESDVVMTSPDFYPTLLEAAGLAVPAQQRVDGTSLMPALKGQPFERGPIFWHYPHYGNQGGTPGSSIRWGNWKLIEFFETGKIELYNLKTDVSESTNRAADQPALARKLHGELVAWRESVGAVMPKTNPDFTPSTHPSSP
jgi:arylsulfatase A-like enzyme